MAKRKMLSEVSDHEREVRMLQEASREEYRNKCAEATKRWRAEHPDAKFDKSKPVLDEKDLASREAFVDATMKAVMHLNAGIGRKVQNDDELLDRANEFLMVCVASEQLPTIENLALSLGTSTQWIEGVISGKYLGFTSNTKDILLGIRTSIASIYSEMALRGKIAAIPYIFYSKNHLGMVDKKNVEINVNVGQKTAEQLLDEAKMLPDFVDIPGDYDEKSSEIAEDSE